MSMAILPAVGRASTITDGGFEESVFGPYPVFGGAWQKAGVDSGVFVPTAALTHSGSAGAEMYQGSSNNLFGKLYQTLNTDPSAGYVLTFWLWHDGSACEGVSPTCELKVEWGGTLLNPGTVEWDKAGVALTGYTGWNQITIGTVQNPLLVTGTSTLLTFEGATTVPFLLDDVSLTSQTLNVTDTAPEPATLFLCGLALLGAGWMRRRASSR